MRSPRINSSSTETDSVNSKPADSADSDRVLAIDGLSLFDKLRTMCTILPDTVKSPQGILCCVHAHRLHELLPNVSKCFRGVANFVNSSRNRSVRRT